MKYRFPSYCVLLLCLLLLQNCSTKRNTFIHRGFHNMTARFNGYYWSNEAIKDGVFKIEKAYKDNFEKVLPVFILPTNENAKATFPDFDKAIKKSSLVIQRHTIRDKRDNEIPTAGKWIDNNWINIGIAHFYKREFFSGIEAFEYVSHTYKTKDKYAALLWQAKSLNEIGSVSQSAPIISLLDNDKKLPKKTKNQLYAVKADYYIKRGLNKEAIAALVSAAGIKGWFSGVKRKQRARYAFIAAQLSEQDKDIKRARQYYTRAIGLKPSYDMVFYSTIKLARLFDIKSGNTDKLKGKLLKMARDPKNTEYLDVIYYTLAEIEEKDKNMNQAIAYYKKSAQSSVSNPSQKATSFLRLGEIYFDRTEYQVSGAYYDSTIAVLPKDHPDYTSISNRRKTLDALVGYITTIQREDSLQKMARMSESDRNKAIDKMIAKIEEEEQRKKDLLEAALAAGQAVGTNTTATTTNLGGGNGPVVFYFYNQTTVSFGVSDFAKRWGNRKLEDNWRRSQKGLVLENEFANDT
ncbi:MAG: type IX secretion system periplasmic lipoprotein PorW/SprE, partial [Bacteroidia bacterium]